MNGFLVFLGLLLIAGGTLAARRGLAELRRAAASARWPTAPGRVTAAEIVEHAGGSGFTYSPRIAFAYQVAGRDYAGNALYLGAVMSSAKGYAKAATEKYPVGAEMAVAYDPADPATAVLEPGVRPHLYLVPFAALVIAAAGVALLVYQAALPYDG